jgi:nicotinate-nucleotide--dimethylbenzimidazole phosphoribosyltransferase
LKLLDKTLQAISRPDNTTYLAAQERLRNQARPRGSLGKLEDISARLASIYRTLDVHLKNKAIVVCAGDHGICEEGVSLFPSEVTPQMIYNFVNGGASINILARHADAEVFVADIGVDFEFEPTTPIFHKKVRRGTANFARGPAMSRREAIQSIEAGIEIVNEIKAQKPIHMLGTGDMGIGNTSPSTAIIAVYSGMEVEQLCGRGTGLDDDGLQHKIDVINQGLTVNNPDPADPLDVLAKVGGFEIGGLAGLVLGAAACRVPIICDGIISTAGALLACELAPEARHYLFPSHKSVENGHHFMLQHLGLNPLLDLDFRLGEGTGAALAMELLDASTRILSDISTFEEVAIKNAHEEESNG